MSRYDDMTRTELLRLVAQRDEQLAALSVEDEGYRRLFMSVAEAFFLSEIVFDDAGSPCDYRYLDANPAFERIVGLSRGDIIGRTLKEVVPNHTPVWMDLFRKVASTGTSSYLSYFSDPFQKHFHVFAFVPAASQYAVLITDFTERNRAEAALAASEARLRIFIEHAPACLAMFDTEMNYLCASRRWIESYALSGKNLIGRCAYDVSPEIPEAWRQAHRRGLSGEVVSCDGEKFQLSDGTAHWESWKVHPWYDDCGAIGGIVIYSEDISAVKEAEEELRKSERRYRDIVQNQTEYVDRYLPGGILTFVNDALAKITGLKPQQLLGRSFYHFLHEDERDLVITSIESLSAENPYAVVENKVHLPDGVRWLQWKHCALTDADGKIVEYQATGRDITERKLMQDQLLKHQKELKEANELLEQRVKERTADLQTAIRAQESFSYSVSHDLRAPLRHINSFSAILLEDYCEYLPPQARECLMKICSASNRMGALIDHLLELSRVTRTKVTPAPVGLSEMAAEVMDMFQETEPWRCCEVAIEEGISVMGDRSLLRQLLENLLGNAWKYTAKKTAARIELGKCFMAGEEVYFVRDNGAGFHADQQEKLFHPFERLHGPEFEGVGIGLATAQRIIQRHGGAIWADGKVGEGATFYFTLPVYF